MSVTSSSTIVGVFRDQSMAEQAVNALYNAGFGQEQIQYMVPGTSGSFFEGLKNFLTGTYDGGENLIDDLTSMGLSDADARYYASEYNNGNPILIVKAAERGTEAMSVLHQYGAYNTQTEPAYSAEADADTQHSAAYTQQDSSTADMQPSSDYTSSSSYGAPGQHDNIQNLEAQPQTPAGEEHPYAGAQPENATPEYDLSDQDTRIITPLNETQTQDMQTDTVTPVSAYDTGNQISETDTAMDEQKSDMPASPLPSVAPQEYGVFQDAQSGGSVSETDMHDQYTDHTPGDGDYAATQSSGSVSETDMHDQQGDAPDTADYQTTQADTTTPEQDYSSQTDQTAAPAMNGYDSPQQQAFQATPETSDQATEMQPAQASAASPEQTDELQQLQTQLQTLQQQLEEAKARLAEAKEQENQLRTAREREQRLQSARQQLQDVQAELQATLAEYQEVQSRITQYQ